MAAPKFTVGDRVKVYVDGKLRRGKVTSITAGHKRGDRRMYEVTADFRRNYLGMFSSKELLSR